MLPSRHLILDTELPFGVGTESTAGNIAVYALKVSSRPETGFRELITQRLVWYRNEHYGASTVAQQTFFCNID